MSIHYHDIYLVFVTVVTLFTILKGNRKFHVNQIDAAYSFSFSPWLIACALILFIGFRDPYSPEFGDSQAYSRYYDMHLGEAHVWDWNAKNILFDNLISVFSSANMPISVFYIFIATIYFGGICFAANLFFKNNTQIAFVAYLAAFSTYSFSINGIKAGAAASLFLVALALRNSGKKILPIIFLFLSIGFHHSMRVPVVAYFVCLLIKKPKFYTFFWIICFIIAALHITYFQELFASVGDEKAIAYLAEEDGFFRTDIANGFRIDFILYSFMPILVGWYALYKKNIQSPQYVFLLNLYTFVNAVWMLCIYASFTNRIAYLSWLMYPFVLVYPFLNENWGKQQFKTLVWVLCLHLGFTIFMTYLYY